MARQNTNPTNRQLSARHFREAIMTKNILLGAITALLLAPTTVLAADLPMKAVRPCPPLYNWTGFYIGATAGLSLGTSDHLDPASGVSFAQGYDLKGGLAGGTIGYNWQMSQFVLGFEGDGSWVGEHGSSWRLRGRQGPLGGMDSLSRASPRKPGSGRLASAFGYAANNLLYYGTGGYAVAGAGRCQEFAPILFSIRRRPPAVAGRQAAVSNGDLRRTGQPSSSCST